MNLLHYSNVIRLLKTENNNKYIIIIADFSSFPLLASIRITIQFYCGLNYQDVTDMNLQDLFPV
jgi:hypothetical protein